MCIILSIDFGTIGSSYYVWRKSLNQNLFKTSLLLVRDPDCSKNRFHNPLSKKRIPTGCYSRLVGPFWISQFDFQEGRYKSKSGARCPATCPPCDFPEAVSVGRKKDLPQCKPGTGIFWDECECCRRCASQINEKCDLLHPCDETKGLTCQVIFLVQTYR